MRRFHLKYAIPLKVVLTAWAIGLMSGCGASNPEASQNENIFATKAAPVLPRLNGRPPSDDRSITDPAAWQVSGEPHGKTLPIVAQRGYCVGDRPPRLAGAHVLERGAKIYVTAYVEVPRPDHRGDCMGYGGFQFGTVQLGREARGSEIYDVVGGRPVLRWPKRRFPG